MALLFTDTLFHYRREKRFFLHEFVVMPNHVHLLLTPAGIALERTMQFVKGGFFYRARKELGLNIEIWERGYVDHRIRDGNDYSRHVTYIHDNPVESRFVIRVEDYP